MHFERQACWIDTSLERLPDGFWRGKVVLRPIHDSQTIDERWIICSKCFHGASTASCKRD